MLKFYKNISLRSKIVLIVLVISILSTAVGSIAAYYYELESYKSALIENTIADARLISEYCVMPLEFNYPDQAKEVLSKLESMPNIKEGIVYDMNETVFASFRRDETGTIKVYPGLIKNEYLFEGEYLHVIQPIKYKNKYYGYIYLRAFTNISEISRNKIIVAVSLTMGLVFLALILSTLMQRAVTNPILRLTKFTGKVSASRDYNLRIKPPGSDEVGRLYTEFNLLLDTVKNKEIERDMALEELKLSEEKFSKAFYTSPDVVTITTFSDHIYLEVNQGFTNFTGYTAGEALGKSPLKNDLNLWVSEEAQKLFINTLKEKGEINGFEMQSRYKDGSIKTGILSAKIIEFNKVPCVLSVIKDITDRKQAEEAFINEKLFSDAVLDSVPGLLYLFDAEGRLVRWNRKMEIVSGYSSKELSNKFVGDFIDVSQNKSLSKTLREIVDTGHGSTELNFITKNGRSITYYFTGTLLITSGKKYFVGIGLDITERIYAEKALKESEELYRKLVSTIPDIIVRTDMKGDILFVNDSNQSFWGYEYVKKIFGRNIIEFIFGEDRSKADKNLKAMLEGAIGPQEYRLMVENGGVIECEVNGDVLRDLSGNPTGIVYTVRNISERKKTEKELENYRLHLEELIRERTAELEKVNKLLQEEIVKQKESEKIVKAALSKEKELNELKTRFISITSHEFRTPLTTIFSSTELLERYGLKWEKERYYQQIERIKNSVRYLTNLIEDVLIISRSESGKIKFEPKPVNLSAFLNNILHDVKILLTESHSLDYKFNISNKNVMIDEKLIKFIVMNLLSNAVKYSVDGGKIGFYVNCDNEHIHLEISDQGIGIPEADRPHLFEPFNRGGNTGNIHGTGLGMSIVKRSIEMQGGTISFTSKLNEGTVFHVNIPLSAGER